MGMGREAGPLRFNWSTPIIMSPHNPRTIYMGAQHLFRSVDRGDHWMIISPDLTTQDPARMVTGGSGIALGLLALLGQLMLFGWLRLLFLCFQKNSQSLER